MSGEEETTNTDVGEQPQSGQAPQGGQAPQSGQPPQGGQAAAQSGQAYGQGGQQQFQQGPGLLDKLQAPYTFEHIKAAVLLYTVIGAGLGLTGILVGIVDSSPISIGGTATGGLGGLGQAMSGLSAIGGLTLPLSGGIYLAAIVAVGVGVRFAAGIAEDLNTTAAAAAVASYAGAFLLWLVGGVLTSIGLDGLSVDFGGLLVLSLVGGIGVAAVAAGTVFVERRFVPA